MRAKEYLESIALIDAQIEGTLADMQRWFDRATSITQQPKTIVKVEGGAIKKTIVPPSQGGGVSDKVGDSVAAYVDIELEADLKELLAQRQAIINTIRQLRSKDQFAILWQIYVMGKTNQEVADMMHKSVSWIIQTKAAAIIEIDKLIKIA